MLVPDFRGEDYEGARGHLGKVKWKVLGLGESQDCMLGPDDREQTAGRNSLL